MEELSEAPCHYNFLRKNGLNVKNMNRTIINPILTNNTLYYVFGLNAVALVTCSHPTRRVTLTEV